MTKASTDLRSLARSTQSWASRHWPGRQNSTSDSARVQAVSLLLDRGWGKAVQPHTGEDGNDIRVTIRQITETIGGENKPE